MMDLLPSLHDGEFGDEPRDLLVRYRQLGAAIQDLARRAPHETAVETWRSRVREAIDRQRDELERQRIAREKDFYRRLLDLNRQPDIEPLLDEALALVVEITGASMAYLELRDSESPRYWRGYRLDDNDITAIRSSLSRGIISRALSEGRTIETPSAKTDERFADLGSVRQHQIEATICVPVGKNPPFGVIYLQGPNAQLTSTDREHLELFACQLASLADRLVRPTASTDHTRSVRRKLQCSEISGHSQATATMLTSALHVAALDVHVLITGPSGTGKSMLARTIANNGPRRGRAFVELNCAALPEQLLESELFGAERGAHSTATRRIPGKLAAAEGGTLFLDEVAELSPGSQAKLLQFLETREYYPLGSTTVIQADVRILAATNADLLQLVDTRRFREDLFYRLHVIAIEVPGLAARGEDIPELVERFVSDHCRKHRLPPLEVSRRVIAACQVAQWPGNIRQLSHAIEAGVIRAQFEKARCLFEHHVFPTAQVVKSVTFRELTRDFQRRVVLEALERNHWNVTESARELQIARTHLHNLINEFELARK